MSIYPQLIAAPAGTRCGATYTNEGRPEQCPHAATAMVQYAEGGDWVAQCDLHRPELPKRSAICRRLVDNGHGQQETCGAPAVGLFDSTAQTDWDNNPYKFPLCADHAPRV